jgi:hypothetical protein
MDSAEQCVDDLRRVCKKSYVLGGPVTSKSGRDKCRQDLRDAGVWGRDRSKVCKDDPEACNHEGCADRSERGDFAQLVAEAAPEMATTSSLAMGMMKSKMADLQSRKNAMLGRSSGGKRVKRTRRRRKTVSVTRAKRGKRGQRRMRRGKRTRKIRRKRRT